MKKIKMLFSSLSLAVVGLVVAAQGVLAAPSSTPEEVLAGVGDAGINTIVDLLVYFVTNYYGYLIVFIILAAMFMWFKRGARLGQR